MLARGGPARRGVAAFVGVMCLAGAASVSGPQRQGFVGATPGERSPAVGSATSTLQSTPLVLALGGLGYVGTAADTGWLRSFHLPWHRSAVLVDSEGEANEVPLQ